MRTIWRTIGALVIGLSGAFGVAQAAVVPFTEDFTADAADWADNTGLSLLQHVASDGPDDGAYASTQKALNGLGDQSVVLFRAQDEFNSSGHAFEGNWISDGVGQFSALVRHNAPLPLNYFARFSGPGNFPGASAVKFTPVLPNTWTQLTFNINAGNPEFVTFEGSSFATVFSNVGHVQLGVRVPEALNTNTSAFTFDIDKALITAPVPEPATLTVSILAIGLLSRRRPAGRTM